MKITICCKQFGPGGGAEKFLANFARCLVEDGHSVRALAATITGEVQGIETAPLHLPPVPKALRDLMLARAARDALDREQADVTFSDQKCWGADVVRPGGGVQREYVKQRIKTFRPAPYRLLKRLQYALSIREKLRIYIDDRLYAEPGPRLVIANSDMVRRNLEKHYPHLRERITVVYNGADPERFHPGLREEHRKPVRDELDIPPDALVGVFVGTGWRRKGLHTFIRALGVLSGCGVIVYAMVVGRGSERKAGAYAAAQGVADQIRFVGRTSPEPYYGAADMLVLPTFFDPCANVTVEALACGLPVVTSCYNGAYELITPGREGFWVEDAADAEGVAEAIGKLRDTELRRSASRAARALALQHTLERQYREIKEAIVRLAKP
ncbi:MAG: glycosyltransferase family 4 protein [Candidatus Brocadiia bacterium]